MWLTEEDAAIAVLSGHSGIVCRAHMTIAEIDQLHEMAWSAAWWKGKMYDPSA